MGKWASSSLRGIDSRGSDSPRLTTSGAQMSGWASLLPTLLAFPSTAFPRPRPLPRPCARPLPLPTPLPKDLLAQTTRPPRPRCLPRLQTRRQGLPIARFCFALALCAAIFKPTITWKRNGSAIVVGVHSSVVKRFLFVQKVQLLQGCLCIPMASVTSRWERETTHLWSMSKNFGKNLNMNTPKRLDHCKEQLNAKPHAQSCCNATNENEVKVPQSPSTVYGRFCHWRTRMG